MHWSQFGWTALPAVLVFAQRAEAATSQTAKFANFTLAMGALATGIVILSGAVVKVRKEQMAVTKGTDRAALVKLRKDHDDLKVAHEKTKNELDLANARIDRLMEIVLGWSHSELVEIPKVGHHPALTDHGLSRVILPDPAATLPGAGL